jgi:uracil-DNA glycosylase
MGVPVAAAAGTELGLRDEYRRLVEARRRCRLCPSLTNPSVVQKGALDSSEIGPYSTWQADLRADLLVVAKDFAPVEKFVEYSGRPGPRVRTNVRLQRFLALAGYPIGPPDAPSTNARVFLTNAVLCLPGGSSMRTTVPRSAVRICAREFLRPLLKLIRPRAVVSLGGQATTAALEGLCLATSLDFRALTREPSGLALPDGGRLFPVPHPAASKPLAEHEASWLRIGTHAT